MKEIQLTKGYKTQVDDVDYEGLVKYNWYASVSNRGNGYVSPMAFINGKNMKMSRFIMNAIGSNVIVDHKDCNPLNNQRANLRFATRRQNARNRGATRAAISRFVGVSWHKSRGKWAARIKRDGKVKYGGRHKNECTAAYVVNKLIFEYGDEFQRPNILTEEQVKIAEKDLFG